MSILVKGMEMPNSCYDCRFFVDTWCYAFGINDWRNAYNKPPKGKRLDNCPLIEVSTPHGRLIDADALCEYCDNVIDHSATPNDIMRFPTIIPAERSE